MTPVDLESAVETVVAWLDAHGHYDIAQAVAAATDPDAADRSKAARDLASMATP